MLTYYLSGRNHYDQGTDRLKKDNYEGTITSLTKYIRRKPGSCEAHYYRGLARYYERDLKGALADLDDAVRLIDDDTRIAPYFLRGVIHLALGHGDKAAQDLERAHDLASPDEDKALLGLVAARHAQGRVEEVASLWQELLVRDERFSDLDWAPEYARSKHPRADLLIEEVRRLVTTAPKEDNDGIQP
jgi:tetratricopeptide (TPR) repeat protein